MNSVEVNNYQGYMRFPSVNLEGNENIQLWKVAVLTCQYKSFPMEDGECVDDLFGRMQVLLMVWKPLDRDSQRNK